MARGEFVWESSFLEYCRVESKKLTLEDMEHVVWGIRKTINIYHRRFQGNS